MDLRNIIQRINKFLQRQETASERKELFEWFDRLEYKNSYSEQDRAEIGVRAKQRVMESIQPVSGRNPKRGFKIVWSGIAASLLLLGFVSYWFYFVHEREASVQELAQVVPGKDDHAIILLPNGQAVNVDSIGLSSSIQVGTMLISKNAEGEISYEAVGVKSDENPMYVLQTPRSSTSEIILADGTKVLLNGGSKLTYPAVFSAGDRIVTLDGEAYFQVSKTSNRDRFIVKTKGQHTEVLGTKFNINAYPGELTKTTLEEGVVQVVADEGKPSTLRLQPGYQAIRSGDVLVGKPADLESVLGWTKGVFYFDGSNTGEVLQQIERWYNIEITYEESKPDAQYVGKIPRNLSLDKLIDLLAYAEFKVQPKINKQNKINLIIN